MPNEKRKGFFQSLWNRAFGRFSKRREPEKAVKQIYTKRAQPYSPEKQKKLEETCEKLFEKQEFVSTGKLQLIGLSKIKKRLGKTWFGLQEIVYREVEESISKYMMPRDIFIRYKDDSYVIIFADAGPEESQIKATLIAEEIKRRLFDHEEEELRTIDVEESVSVFATRDLKKKKNLSETMDVIFDGEEGVKKPSVAVQKPEPKKPVEIPQAIEVDPYSDTQKAPEKGQTKKAQSVAEGGSSLKFNYVPLWDTKKNFLTTYLCVARKDSSDEDPIDAHERVFMGGTPSERVHSDLQVLQAVTEELAAMEKDGRQLYIACPVHYATLDRAEGYEKYILACQKIPQEHKRFLVFLLLGLPAKVHAANIPKFAVPLRKHCSAIHAQVPLDSKVDFALFRECNFEAVGVRLKRVSGGEKQLLERLDDFATKAKKALIKKTFVLDVSSLSVTTSVVCADYDFLAGSAIHESVSNPDSVYRFKHENLFSGLIDK